jgi:small subunit ribosomal protein S5
MPAKTPYDKAARVPESAVTHVNERVILIRRIAKVTAGGKHLRFNALVAVGDGMGHVGLGMGKAEAVPDAVRKGVAIARKNIIRVPLRKTTVPHAVQSKYRASVALLRPAVDGTGVLAGATMRAVVELAGVKDILGKSLGNPNPINLARATMDALASLRDPESPGRRVPQPPAQAQAQAPASAAAAPNPRPAAGRGE